VLDCTQNSCPDHAACVFFNAAGAGCPYPPGTGSSECMKTCHTGSDCRDGYVCASPVSSPWSATILDSDQTQLVCIVPVDAPPSVPDASVCRPQDAATDTGLDTGTSDASAPDDAKGPVDGGDSG
jgi:hypothetical protein